MDFQLSRISFCNFVWMRSIAKQMDAATSKAQAKHKSGTPRGCRRACVAEPSNKPPLAYDVPTKANAGEGAKTRHRWGQQQCDDWQ